MQNGGTVQLVSGSSLVVDDNSEITFIGSVADGTVAAAGALTIQDGSSIQVSALHMPQLCATIRCTRSSA